jgi:tetratricopeptide (TPR) repeat protein
MSVAGTIGSIARTRGPKIGLMVVVAVVIGGLASLDVFLERAEQAEMAAQAERAYEQGRRLLESGRAKEAIDALRRAHAMERKNLGYEVELVAALTAAGKTAEAEPLMNEVLDADRNDGAANLVAARLRLKEGKIVDAEAFYHRAIYGTWPQDAESHRIAARVELIDLMVAKGQKQELLAELLPLQEEAKSNPAIDSRLAQLFLLAGSPGRAADVYRELIREDPKNADYYAGFGEAELEQGDYRAAHAAFASAAARKKNDPAIRTKLQLATMLAGLDPTPRRLSSAEKYQRSLYILEWAQQDLEKCIQTKTPGATSGEQALQDRAEEAMDNQTPAHASNELSEATLSLAVRIWQARLTCNPAIAPDEEPLRLLMAKVTQ